MSGISPISATGGVSSDTTRLGGKDNLEAAGKRFEAIFVGMMLKSMRTAKLGDGLFDNKAGEQFRDMQDQQLSESMAAHTPIGIGKAMTDFLKRGVPTDAATGETAPAATPASGSAA